MVSTAGLSLDRSEQAINRAHPLVLAVGLFVALGVVSLPLAHRFYSNGLVDISEYLNNAFRVLNGELPYRDFWLFHPPGEVFLPAALYRLFGVQINAVLTASVLLNVLAGVLSFAFARQILGENVLAAATALLSFFNGIPTHAGMAVVDPSGHYFLPLLLGAMALLRYTATSKKPMLFVSGVSVGCASLLRLFDAMPALVACVVALWMHERTRASTIRRTGSAIGIFAAGVVSVWLAVSAALWPIWHLMLREMTVGALAHHVQFYHGMQTWLPLQWEVQYIIDRAAMLAQTGSPLIVGKLGFWILTLINHLALYVLPVVVVAVAIRLVRRGFVSRADLAVLVLLLVWGFGGLAKALKNPTIIYWVTGTTPLVFLLGLLIKRIQPARMRAIRWALSGTAMVLALGVPMGIAAAAFRLVAVSEPIDAPNGSMLVEDAQYAGDVRQVLATILEQTQAADLIFADPYHLPPLYAMTGRRNPSYYDSPQVLFGNRLGGLPTEREERRICGELLSHHTRLVVTDRQPTVGPFRVLQQCLEAHFDLAGVVGSYALYVARQSP